MIPFPFGLSWAKLALIAGAAVVAVTAYLGWRGAQREIGREEVRAEWAAERAAVRATMQAQADRNQELQRAAEKRYTVQAGVRERVIVETITEIRHAAAPLAACPVPDAARVRLNAAAACAREDSAAACGPVEPMPGAR